MPIYEYHCASCSHELEALQKVSDSPLRKCPACGKLTLRRLISAPVFRLKGAGWYETDFKSDAEQKRNLVETSGGDSSDGSKPPDAASKADTAPSAADAASKEAKKPAEKPAASKVPKPRKMRTARPTRT